MNRETIQELAIEAARYKYKCRECRKRERCTMHTGALRPSELRCPEIEAPPKKHKKARRSSKATAAGHRQHGTLA